MNQYQTGLLPRPREMKSLDSRLAIEATVVGLLVIVVGIIIQVIMKGLGVAPSNKTLFSAISLFFTGVAVHVGCEMSGINEYYVQYYKNSV